MELRHQDHAAPGSVVDDPTASLSLGIVPGAGRVAGVPNSVAPPVGQPRFPLIDALRAIAALSVLLFHTGYASGAVFVHDWGRYVARLDAGVAIFFVISGFLLYRPFVASRLDGRRRPSVARYALNRALRIVPAYWIALTVLLALGLIGFAHGSWLEFYAFGQVYDSARSLAGLGPAWSLCVEVTFYAALPFVALAMTPQILGRSRRAKLRAEVVMLALLYCAAVGYRLIIRGIDGPGPNNLYQVLPAFLDWFALGMAVAVASVAFAGRPLPWTLRWVSRFPLVSWGIAAALMWTVTTRLGAGFFSVDYLAVPHWILLHVLYGFLALAVVLPAIFGWDQPAGVPREVLRKRGLAWLGLISYGIFLYNQPIIAWLGRSPLHDATMLAILLVGFTLTVALAAASYYLLEEPLLRAKRDGRRRPPSRRSVAASAAAASAIAPSPRSAAQ